MAEGYTIGEVLNQVKEDFADITISKIRFLESEGLISPARTESGYRSFTDDDVDRLRFILTAQRDHYLPLKVIREQLDKLDAGDLPTAGPGHAAATAAEPPGEPEPRGAAGTLGDVVGADGEPDLADPVGAPMTLRELCDAAELSPSEAQELRDYGLIGEGSDDGSFDATDLAAARVARQMLQLGLEARHLRMYRQFCNKEVDYFRQLTAPLLLQRNTEARRQATRQLQQLAGLSQQLHLALLAGSLRSYLHGS